MLLFNKIPKWSLKRNKDFHVIGTASSQILIAYNFACVLCMCIVLTSCNPNQNLKPISLSDSKTTNPPITFSALITDPNAHVKWGLDPVSAKITESTGVSLKTEILTGDLSTRIGTMIASNNYPDMILSIDNDSVARLAEAQALFPLDDFIENSSKNIKRIFGNDLAYMKNEQDGNIYGVNREYKGISAKSEAMFFVQYSMLKESGYPKLKTLDDLFNIMKAYKQKHPNYEGMETIGLSFWGDSYGMNVTLNNPALGASGLQNDGNYIVNDDLSVKYALTSPYVKEYLLWLNKLYLNNLLDKDAIIQNRSNFVKKIAQGNVLVVTTENWDMGDSEALLRKEGKSDKCYAQIPLYSNSKIDSRISNYNPYGSWKSVITKNCNDKERAFEFFDTMWSEEMQVLCNWGVEGMHYDIKEGKRVQKSDLVRQTSINPDWKSQTGILIYNMWSYGENVKSSDGQYIVPFGTKEELYNKMDSTTKEILQQYGIKSWKDLCPPSKPSPWGFAWNVNLPQNTNGAYAENKVNRDIRTKYLPRIILSNSRDQFNVNWDAFVYETKQAGIELRENEISNALKKRTSVIK